MQQYIDINEKKIVEFYKIRQQVPARRQYSLPVFDER